MLNQDNKNENETLNLNKSQSSYSYSEFKEDAKLIAENTQHFDNFKWDLYSVNKDGDFLLNSLGIVYLKSNIYVKALKDEFLIQFDVIYSEIYQMPSSYFIITQLPNEEREAKIIKFEEYLEKIKDNTEEKISTVSDFISKGFEVSKTVSKRIYIQ